jgi:ABC-2 type transport system permease protein
MNPLKTIRFTDQDSILEGDFKMKPLKTVEEILTIAYKDLKEFQRNRIGLFFSIVMPVFLIAMFGYMFPSSTNVVHDVSVGIINLDNGTFGKQVFSMINQSLSNSTAFKLVDVDTVDDAKNMIFAGTIKGVVVIPENLTESLLSNNQAKITILNDPTNTALSAAIIQGFSALINAVSHQFAFSLIVRSIPGANPQFILQPIQIDVQSIVTGGGSYFDFVAPGFIGLGVMMSGLTAVGVALAREREIGTLDGLLMAPISRVSIILGKTLAQTIRNLLQGSLIIILAIFVFGVHVRGDPFLIAIILVLGTLSFLGIGIVATAIAKEQESAQFILGFLQFPMMFLSGVLFPVEQMPLPLQYVSKVLPLTYAVDALRKVMVLGVGLDGVIFELFILVIISVVTIALGVPLFDRAVRK